MSPSENTQQGMLMFFVDEIKIDIHLLLNKSSYVDHKKTIVYFKNRVIFILFYNNE